MNDTTPLLTEVIDRYIVAKNNLRPIGRELSPKTKQCYLEHVQIYRAHLRREPTVDDLAAEKINEFLAAKLAAGASPYTVKSCRAHLRALVRFAGRQGLTDADPDDLRQVYCPPLQVEGYDLAAMECLTVYLATQCGVVRGTGIPRAVYWTSLVRAKWDIGARAEDMLGFAMEHFDPRGWLYLHQPKTGKVGWKRLNVTTAEAIAACIAARPERQLIWPGYRPNGLCRAFSELAGRAGTGGRLQFIRRGCSSEYEYLNPGSAWRFLRHSDPRVFDNNYRIGRIVDRDSPLPPEIGVDDTSVEIWHRATTARAKEVVPTTRRIEAALEIHKAWQSVRRLTGELIECAVEELDIAQKQLAQSVGLTPDWINALIRGRELVSRDTDRRLRLFVEQLAKGETPTPIGKDSLAAPSPLAVPMTDEVRDVLLHEPLRSSDLAVVAHWLQTYGVPQRQLADWWGYKFKFYQNMRYGYKRIPPAAAKRLREMFLPVVEAATA